MSERGRGKEEKEKNSLRTSSLKTSQCSTATDVQENFMATTDGTDDSDALLIPWPAARLRTSTVAAAWGRATHDTIALLGDRRTRPISFFSFDTSRATVAALTTQFRLCLFSSVRSRSRRRSCGRAGGSSTTSSRLISSRANNERASRRWRS